MPDLYFNPYPGTVPDMDAGRQALLSTARAVEELRSSIDRGLNPDGDCPISAFTLVNDPGICCKLSVQDLLKTFRGVEHEIVMRLYLLFSRGGKLTKEMLCEHENITLKSLSMPVPVLEYALKHDGMTSSFATDPVWKSDFLEFGETTKVLPNIWGQENLSPIIEWINNWNIHNKGYKDELLRRYNAIICKGALNSCNFSSQEWEIIFEKLDEAIIRKYEADGYMIKDVENTLYGPLKQIKQRGSALRLYLSLIDENHIIIGGVYKKGNGSSEQREKIVQGKAISQAKKRINAYRDVNRIK